MTVVRVSVEGKNLTTEQIAEALAKHFPDRTVVVDNDTVPKFSDDAQSDKICVSLATKEHLESLIEQKEKAMKDMELESTKAVQSVQAFHKQQQALFDEFVLLRQRYDEQKASLLSILWISCSQYHPELRTIPPCHDDGFVEHDTRIGDYILGDFLGEGQFATVRTCWRCGEDGQTREGPIYALKTIRKEKITSLQSLKRVANEIEILQSLKSEYVITIHDVVHTEDILYLITEKGGGDMFEFFDEHPEGVPEHWAREIVTSVLKAVHYCHEHNVCHRDLKPENILLQFDQESGRCLDLKLCDFGLSTRFQHRTPLTDFCGSPGFFAPEMIMYGKYYGDKADVWSIGCILLELVLGHEKFCDLWMTAYDYEIMQDKERFGREIAESVARLPEELELPEQEYDFILRLLKLRSSERPVTKLICTHPWLDGAFGDMLVPPMLDPVTPKASFRGDSLSPSLSGKSLGAMTPTSVDVSKVVISQRERHMLEVDTERSGHSLHLPPLEPATPSVGRARKLLNTSDAATPTAPNGSLFHPNGAAANNSSFHSPASRVDASNAANGAGAPNGAITLQTVGKAASEPNRSGKDRDSVQNNGTSPRSIHFENDRNSLIRSASCNGLLAERGRLQSVSEHDTTDGPDSLDPQDKHDFAAGGVSVDNANANSESAFTNRRLASKEMELSPLLTRGLSGENLDGNNNNNGANANGKQLPRVTIDPVAKQLFDGSKT